MSKFIPGEEAKLLKPLELTMIRLAANGLSFEVLEQMPMARDTITQTGRSLLAELNVITWEQAISIALERKILQPDDNPSSQSVEAAANTKPEPVILTNQEKEILQRYSRNTRPEQVARQLELSRSDLDRTAFEICYKIGTFPIKEAVKLALGKELIPKPSQQPPFSLLGR